MQNTLQIPNDLTTAVKAVAPVHGVRFVDFADKSTWMIWFCDEATDEQKTAAQAVIDAFDLTQYSPTGTQNATAAQILAQALLAKGVINEGDITAAEAEIGSTFEQTK